MIQVKFTKLRAGARKPVYATSGSAAADLFACLDDISELDGLKVENGSIVIPPSGRAAIPIGISIEPVISSPRFGFHGSDRHGEYSQMKPCGSEDDAKRDTALKFMPHRRTAFPDSYAALIFGRSGHGAKFGVTLANSVGVVDSDYRGEIKVTLINHGEKDFLVTHGDRVAQLAFMPVSTARFIEVQSLGETERGSGGFGSTGR